MVCEWKILCGQANGFAVHTVRVPARPRGFRASFFFLDLLMTFFCWILIGNPRLCETLLVHIFLTVYYLKSVGGKFEINFDGKIEIFGKNKLWLNFERKKRLSFKIWDLFRSNHIKIFSFHRLLTFLSLHSTSQLNFLIKFIGFNGQKFLVII